MLKGEMEKVIGIDLGTTNSCVAVVENGSAVVISNRGGYKTTPSMVAVSESGKRVVGHIAKRQAITNAEHTVYAAKRLIGRKWGSAEVESALATCSYRIVKGPHEDARIVLRDKELSIPEISAVVLQEMKIIAETHLGETVSKAVVTVPAYFNDNQRQATKDAGEIAGLNVIRIINEPTAAALSYGYGKDEQKTVVVYDFGGGTFDVSILEIAPNGMFRVVATAGDTFLGGEDMDNTLLEWLITEFRKEHDVDLTTSRMALQRIKDAAEKAKCELSAVTETEINLPFIVTQSGPGENALHLQRTVTRAKLEELCGYLVESSIQICEQALEEAELEKDEIDEVLLVGGMTRMPMIQRSVRDFFGREPSKNVHPDEAVALGAAIQGAALVDGKKEILLLDVTPHALGLMAYGNVFEKLIEPNTSVPTEQRKVFTTSRDNQTSVKMVVMQGDSDTADDNELLGEFMLEGIRPAPQGHVQIEVVFQINADGMVSVKAKDMETGLEQSIQVTASSGLTDKELEVMFEDAQADLLVRRATEEEERVKQEAQTLIAEVERLLGPVEQVMAKSDFGRQAIAEAKALITSTQNAIEQRNVAAVREHVASLTRTHKMFKGAAPKA
jgi:molecular chaperone DnaK